jgi:tape measure domain-containing protein
MSLTVKIKGDASQFDKTMRGVKATVGGLSSKIGAIGAAAAGAAAGYVTLSKAMEFLQSSSQKAAGMEDLQMSLVTLTGSASGAKKTLKELSDIADKSTFGVDVYADAAKLLIGFGVSADDAIPVLRNLADISMGNQEKFGGLALAFGQAAAGGRLMKEEVNQMIERGFNPLQIIAQRTGESMGDLLKRVSAGGVSIDELKKSMADATGEGGRFNNAMNNAMDTTNGKISMVEKSINKLQIAFGTGFNVGLKNALNTTNNVLPQLETRFKDAGEFIGGAITDAISGNTKKFELIGELIGAAIVVGIKSQVKKTSVGSMEDFLAEMVAGGEMATTRLKGRELALQASQEKDPVKQTRMLIDASRMMNQKSSFQTMYEEGKQYQNRTSQMTSVTRELQPQIDAIQFEQGMTNAMSKSITRDMPRAVREGILEGQRQAREKATFSN